MPIHPAYTPRPIYPYPALIPRPALTLYLHTLTLTTLTAHPHQHTLIPMPHLFPTYPAKYFGPEPYLK